MNNGFTVNEEVRKNHAVRKKKRRGSPFLIVVALLLVLVVSGIIFCARVPVCEIKMVESCEITSTEQSEQIDYYNDKGLIEKTVYFDEGSEMGFVIFTYDEDGKLLKEESTFQGVLSNINTYIYTDGLLTRTELKNVDGTLMSAYDYQYNEDGTLAVKISYDQENKPSIQHNYSYVASRLVKQRILYLSNNNTEDIIYTYEGRFMTKEERKSEINDVIITYTYDNNGRVLTKNVQNGEYIVYKYTYKTVKVPVFKKR